MSFWEHFCFCSQKEWTGWSNHLFCFSVRCCIIPQLLHRSESRLLLKERRVKEIRQPLWCYVLAELTPQLSFCTPQQPHAAMGSVTLLEQCICGWKRGLLLAQKHQEVLKAAAKWCPNETSWVRNQPLSTQHGVSISAVFWGRWSSTSTT